MSDSKTADLLATMDAAVWAREFCRIAGELGVTQRAEGGLPQPIDEGWMISWFANAIMKGYDEGGRHAERRLLGTKEEPVTVQQVEAYVTEHALSLHDGNMTRTARHLGVDRRTLYRWVSKRRTPEDEQTRCDPPASQGGAPSQGA
jgi:hypothetical protein